MNHEFEENAESETEALLEAVVEEFTNELRHGRQPRIVDYQHRYQTHAKEIRELLSSVAMIEQLKSQPLTESSLNRRLEATLEIRQLGDYKIIREIGRGGMGIVFEAIHQSLGRQVAIKVLPNRSVDNEKLIERFRLESQAAARLHHTNIVSVFGVGFADGHHYYVMEYVNGLSVKQIIDHLVNSKIDSKNSTYTASRRQEKTKVDPAVTQVDSVGIPAEPGVTQVDPGLSTMDASQVSTDLYYTRDLVSAFDFVPAPKDHISWSLSVVEGIADAMDYSHRQSILHRDIKPANLLSDDVGNVRLADFGLAKRLDDDGLTKTGEIIGTPQYMAPETLEGRYDIRSEVYCLGLTLYEMVTLQPAFFDTTTAGLLRQITTVRPVAAASLNRQVSRDLNIVIEKAIAREPSDRYQTAAEFREDLRCLLDDRPISARRPSALEFARRWARRNPMSAWLACTSLFLLMLVALTASLGYAYTQAAYHDLSVQHQALTWQQQETERARQLAVESEDRIQNEFQRAEANLKVSFEAFDAMFLQLISPSRNQNHNRSSEKTLDLDIDGLSELAGVQTAITEDDAEFLKRMLSFYQQIASQNADSLELKLQSARANRRVANTYHLTGNMPQAIESYKQACELYDSIVSQTPELESAILALVQTYNEAGQALRGNGEQAAATSMHRLAMQNLQGHRLSDNKALKLEAAKTLNLLCSVETGVNREMQAIPTSLSEDYFGLRNTRNSMVRTLSNRMVDRRKRTGNNRNRQMLQQAIRITDELLLQNPEDAQVRLVRAKSYRGKAVLLDPTQDADEIKLLIDNAIKDLEQLRSDFPENPHFTFTLALTYTLPLGQSKEVQDNYLAIASELIEPLSEAYPQNIEFHQLNSNVHVELAKRFLDVEERDDAIDCLSKARASLGYLVQTTPMLRYYRFEHANVSLGLSSMLVEKRLYRQAVGVLNQSIAEILVAEEKEPMKGANRAFLQKHYQSLIEVYQKTNDQQGLSKANQEIKKYRPRPRPPNIGQEPKSGNDP